MRAKISSPCGGLYCGPSAHSSAAHNQTVAVPACKHVQKVSGGPSAHQFSMPILVQMTLEDVENFFILLILATRCKKWNFDHFWTRFGHYGGLPD